MSTESFIRAIEAGRRERMQEERYANEQEDRKFEKELLQHRIKALGIQDKIQARELAIQNASLMQGQPGQMQTRTAAADLGQGQAPEPVDLPAPGDAEGIPAMLQQLIRGNRAQLQGVPNPAQLVETQDEQPHAPVAIPGVEEYGVPGVSVQPQTQRQVQEQSFAALMNKMRAEAAGKRMENSIETPGERIADKNLAATEARTKQGQKFQIKLQGMRDAAGMRRAAIMAGTVTSRQGQSKAESKAKSFDAQPIVKEYNTLQEKNFAVAELLNRPWNGPADMALIFNFMKALDPTSVVRNEEYDNAAKSGNIFAGWAAKFNGSLNPSGGFLSEQVKKDFAGTLSAQFGVKAKQYKNLRKEFGKQIDRLTGETGGEDYMTDYEAAFPVEAGGPQKGDTKKFPNGATGVFDGTDWVKEKRQ